MDRTSDESDSRLGRPAKFDKEDISVTRSKIAAGARENVERCRACRTTGPCYVGCPGDLVIDQIMQEATILLEMEKGAKERLIKQAERLQEEEMQSIIYHHYLGKK